MRRRDWHAHPQPRTLGDVWDEIAADPWALARDFAALVALCLAGVALYLVLWASQP